MANLNLYPSQDVVDMATVSGFTTFELGRDAITDATLAGLMSAFYAGTLTQVVNPAQGIRPEDLSVTSQFLRLTGEDLSAALEGAGKLLPTVNLALVAIVLIAAVILFK